MATEIRRTGGPAMLAKMLSLANLAFARGSYATKDSGAIANGTTAGKLKTVNAVDFTVNGLTSTKAATDDLWDLSAQTDTIAAQFRAYWLYLNAGGTASIVAGGNAASAADAKLALPAIDTAKSVIGVYIAGPSTDFNAAGGLAAQGTIVDGLPAGTSASPDVTVADVLTLVAV